MQKRCLFLILAAALVAAISLSSLASGISDFGGPCRRNVDCTTGLCSNGVCSAEGPCANFRIDNGETDIDCGGVCVDVKSQSCSLGKKCVENSDCTSRICSSGGRCANQTGVKAQAAAGQSPAVTPGGTAKSSGGNFAAKATVFLIVISIVIFAVAALISFLKRRVISKFEDDLPPLRHSGRKALPPQPHHKTEETILPHHVQQEQPARHRSQHAVFEDLERTYSNLSGEELFEHLRRKTGRR